MTGQVWSTKDTIHLKTRKSIAGVTMLHTGICTPCTQLALCVVPECRYSKGKLSQEHMLIWQLDC